MTLFSRLPVSITNKLHNRLSTHTHTKGSYSQCGEDLILNFAFGFLNIPTPTYLDVGAHHPTFLSNTAFFNKRGSIGVNVEPDPRLFARLKRYRRHDVNLNVGIADEDGELDFYVMSAPELSTFDESQARRLDGQKGLRIVDVEKVKVVPINSVLATYFKRPPDLLSLDVEGFDLRVLKALDFEKCAPLAICVETLEFRPDGKGEKNQDLIEFLIHAGYLNYADTYINTIFFHRGRFDRLLDERAS